MQLAEGVLLVLDPNATPFTRIWCAFEEATVADGELGLLLDIATVYVEPGAPEGKRAAVITEDGPNEEEQSREHRRKREQFGRTETSYVQVSY